MYGSDGPGGGSGGPGGGSGGPGGHWASSAVGSISNPPVSEAGSIFPGAPYNEKTRKSQYQKFHFCSDHIFAGHNEDRGTSWVVILGWLS